MATNAPDMDASIVNGYVPTAQVPIPSSVTINSNFSNEMPKQAVEYIPQVPPAPVTPPAPEGVTASDATVGFRASPKLASDDNQQKAVADTPVPEAPPLEDPTAKASTVNPNEKAQQAQQAANGTAASKLSPYEYLNQAHKVTPQDIQMLEKSTNLTLYPYIFGGELARIKHQFSEMNINKYYLLLNMLVYGFDNKILASSMQNSNKCVIDKNFVNDFLKMIKQPLLQNALKKTPAYQKGCFDDTGKLGVTEANVDNMSNNPISGPKTNHPSLVTNILESIHPGATKDLEDFCNKIRTHAYLSLPKGAFGSLNRMVAAINGVIEAFQSIINDIYNGIIAYIQQIYAYVNGLIAKVQQMLISFIEDIIPLDLLCLLLDTLQCILDDINFFTSLFNMSGSFTNVLNSIQTFTNFASQLVSNPFSTLSAYLPANVKNIIDQVNQIGTDPGGFLADQLSNHGYAWAATALQGNIVGALADKFGPQYAAFNPVGNVLSKAGAIYNRYGQGAQSFPNPAASMGPNIYNGGKEDLYGHPIDRKDIGANVAADYGALTASLSAFGQSSGQFASDVGTSIGNFFKKF